MRSASPAPSVISMTSSMREQMLRQEHGRDLNNYSDVYYLPADHDELDRLEKQYNVVTDVMGKYVPPFHEVMRDEGPGGETKRCLDLGCGSGAWIMDVARDFPHCEAVAVDLAPMQSPSMPPNLRSEVDDINLGLEHFYGDFNVVHAWLIASGIRHYEGLIDQIGHVLRPGGVIDIMEWDFGLHDGNKQRIPLSLHQKPPPWLHRFMALLASAFKDRGGDIEGSVRMATFVQNNPNFEQVVHQDYWFPIGPWMKGNPDMIKYGYHMRADLLEFLNSARPLLLGTGISPEEYELIQTKTRHEMMECRHHWYARLRRVYARKKR
jgi:SAM-dependent methyltransferase